MKKMFIFIPLLAALFLLSSCAGQYFYRLAIERNDKSQFLSDSEDLDLEEYRDESMTEKTEWLENSDYTTLQIESGDGLQLTGYWLPNWNDEGHLSGNTVILFHGYTSNGFQMGVFAEYYYNSLGFNVLAPDARGHGASEGDYIGFGWHERFDVLEWIDEVIKLAGPDSSVVLHGISMGGATVMMASGEALPKQVKALVEDCGYTSVYEQFSYQLKRMFDQGNPKLLNRVSEITREKAGYSFTEASALDQLPKADKPMLFIHGDEDTFVPTFMVYELYEAYPGPKDLYVVGGAGHGLAWITDPGEYQKRLEDFLSSSGLIFEQ